MDRAGHVRGGDDRSVSGFGGVAVRRAGRERGHAVSTGPPKDDEENVPVDVPTPIQQVLKQIMAEVGPIAKDSENREQHFRFRGIDAILNEASPLMAKYGVIPVPRVVDRPEYEAQQTAKGKAMTSCRLVVEYRFYGPAGDHLAAIVPGEASDLSDKATAKAMSVAYRTALIQVLAIKTGDPDPDEDAYERGAPQASNGQQAQAPQQRSAGANAVAGIAQELKLTPEQCWSWYQQLYGHPYQQATEPQLFEFASYMENNPPQQQAQAQTEEPPF